MINIENNLVALSDMFYKFRFLKYLLLYHLWSHLSLSLNVLRPPPSILRVGWGGVGHLERERDVTINDMRMVAQ